MEWMFMPLKRYAEFSGRSRRMEYWMFVLGCVLLNLILWIVAAVTVGFGAMGAASSANAGNGGAALGGMLGMMAGLGILMVVFAIVWLALLIPSIAVAVRRLHDTDRSGWWLFAYIGPYLLSFVIQIMAVSSNSSGLAMIGMVVGLVGFAGAILLLVFMCLPGTAGPNKYGPDPLGGATNLNETFA